MNSGFPTKSSPTKVNRSGVSNRIQPASALVLALGLALAVFSEGQIPELWTKVVLGAMIVPTVITALWLTGPRSAGAMEDGLGPQGA
jgi:hypothetical protein